MKTKILISVKGGTVVSIGANQDIDIVIVDYDSFDTGAYDPVSEVLTQDYIADSFHEMWLEGTSKDDKEEKEIQEVLKALNY